MLDYYKKGNTKQLLHILWEIAAKTVNEYYSLAKLSVNVSCITNIYQQSVYTNFRNISSAILTVLYIIFLNYHISLKIYGHCHHC